MVKEYKYDTQKKIDLTDIDQIQDGRHQAG